MIEQTECFKLWILEQVSCGVFKSVDMVEEAVKVAVDQLTAAGALDEAPARSRYTPEGSPEPYEGD